MTADLRYLSGRGYADLYFGDMFALELTIQDLEKLYESCPVSNPLSMVSLTRKLPDPRIMFFKALGKPDKRALPFPNSLQILTTHFSPELELNETQALQLSPNV